MSDQRVPRRIGPDRILILARAENPASATGATYEDVVEIGPEHRLYGAYDRYLTYLETGVDAEVPEGLLDVIITNEPWEQQDELQHARFGDRLIGGADSIRIVGKPGLPDVTPTDPSHSSDTLADDLPGTL